MELLNEDKKTGQKAPNAALDEAPDDADEVMKARAFRCARWN